MLLKARNLPQRGGEILARALRGIREIEKEPALFAAKLRGDAGGELRPDGGHLREHGPVHERDERGLAKDGEKFFLREMPEEIRPVHFLEALVLAAHELAVLEFDGVGVAGFGDGNDARLAGERRKNGMDIGRAEVADVGGGQPGATEGVGHDGAIAAELHHLRDELEIGAQPGGGIDAGGKIAHAGEPRVFRGGFPLGDDVEDGIDEAVEADEDLGGGEAGGPAGEGGGGGKRETAGHGRAL